MGLLEIEWNEICR